MGRVVEQRGKTPLHNAVLSTGTPQYRNPAGQFPHLQGVYETN
jgi:hypothetical protein